MTKRAACPPPPPVGQPATLHFHTLKSDETLYRVYRGAEPAQFSITSTNNRFDPLPAPWNATKVLYAGSSKEVAISETVLRWHNGACLTNLEQYLHEPANPVVKAALAHVQFETIHPFLDGNGRVGRLLITLLLCHDNVLRKPLLYPSLYFKQHRQQYYEELNVVRAGGDYERWIDFFAEGVRHSAEVAIETGRRVTQAFHEDRVQLPAVPRIAGSLLMVQEALQAQPVSTVATLREATGLTTPTVNSLLRELESRGIVKESTGRARDRVYVYRRYLEALAAEEEAPVSAPAVSGR
jgi:Fic family protein